MDKNFQQINLQVGAYDLKANMIHNDIFYSKHTDHKLKKIEISFSIPGHERFNDLNETGKHGLLNIEGDIFKRVASSYILSQSNVYTIYWLLEEQEEWAIESLSINGIDVKPYFYKEFMDREALVIVARVVLKPLDFMKLRQVTRKNQVFDLVRRGISEKTIQMILGKNYWSDENRQMKLQFTFIESDFEKNMDISLAKSKLYGRYFKVADIDE